MAGAGSVVFEVRKGVAAKISAESCLFSRPELTEQESEAAVLIHQEDPNDSVVFRGLSNRYHNLESYWSIGDETKEWAEYLAYLSTKTQNQDLASQPMSESPWKMEQPLKGVASALFDEPRNRAAVDRLLNFAFQVNDQLPALRLVNGASVHLIGVERLGSFSYLALMRPIERKPDPGSRKTRIVDPTILETANGVYPTLEIAVKESQPGDIIEIRHNRVLACKPLDLEEATIDLTIKAAEGFHPFLTFGETTESDAALFTVHDAKLRIVGLEFRLKPMREEFAAQSVVNLIGDGSCTLRDCVITLEPGEGKTHLAAANVSSLGPAKMKMDLRPGRIPGLNRLSFDNCVVRGDGDFVWDRGARPFDLRVRNSLVALTGRFLNVDVPRESVAPAGAQVRINLSKVTAYLGTNFLRLNVGTDLRGLIPIQIVPTDCLFAIAAPSRALIHFEGPETDPQKLKMDKLLDWQPGLNGYVMSSSAYFDQQSPGEGISMKPAMDMDSWKSFSGEDRSAFDVKLATGAGSDLKFARATPELIKAQDSRFGADAGPLLKLFNAVDTKE